MVEGVTVDGRQCDNSEVSSVFFFLCGFSHDVEPDTAVNDVKKEVIMKSQKT